MAATDVFGNKTVIHERVQYKDASKEIEALVKDIRQAQTHNLDNVLARARLAYALADKASGLLAAALSELKDLAQ